MAVGIGWQRLLLFTESLSKAKATPSQPGTANAQARDEDSVNHRRFFIMNWNEMCKLEPKLISLQREADQELSDRSSPRFWRKYESIKAQVKRMVGYHSKNEVLATRECYDIAYDNVFRVMK